MSVGTVGKVIGGALWAGGTYSDYKYDKERGKSPIHTVGRLAAEAALFAVGGPIVGAAYVAGSLIVGAGNAALSYAQTGGKASAQSVNNIYNHSMGGNFQDTENAATMRQRGVGAIQQSGNNLNQVFGNEARTFYRGMA